MPDADSTASTTTVHRLRGEGPNPRTVLSVGAPAGDGEWKHSGHNGMDSMPTSYGGKASFTLDGITYEYVRPDPGNDPEVTHSWTYGQYPKVMATIPLVTGAVDVYAYAPRWNASHVLVSWQEDDHHSQRAWIPAGNVRRVAGSEWDIEEYRSSPEHLRVVQRGSRLSGFLPY
jgi:hypothetical protein